MDLSFPRPIPAGDAPLPAADMALLAALLTARGDTRATAAAQAAIDRPAADALLAPAAGAFSATMASRLAEWSDQ